MEGGISGHQRMRLSSALGKGNQLIGDWSSSSH